MARRNMPPLRALMAFEAAARLGSFRLAADELGMFDVHHDGSDADPDLDPELEELRARLRPDIKERFKGWVATAERIWAEINYVNLKENIEATRERATVILRKGPGHAVEEVRLRRAPGRPSPRVRKWMSNPCWRGSPRRKAAAATGGRRLSTC